MERILAADSSNSRWSFGASAPKRGERIAYLPFHAILAYVRWDEGMVLELIADLDLRAFVLGRHFQLRDAVAHLGSKNGSRALLDDGFAGVAADSHLQSSGSSPGSALHFMCRATPAAHWLNTSIRSDTVRARSDGSCSPRFRAPARAPGGTS